MASHARPRRDTASNKVLDSVRNRCGFVPLGLLVSYSLTHTVVAAGHLALSVRHGWAPVEHGGSLCHSATRGAQSLWKGVFMGLEGQPYLLRASARPDLLLLASQYGHGPPWL